MAGTSVSDLIHSSMRLLGAIAAGEMLETAELNDAFVSFQQMIASWNIEGASLPSRIRQLVPLTTSNQYSLATRPVKIDAASAAIQAIDSPIEIVDAVGWEAIEEKAMQSVYIRKLYCDYAYPNSTIYIWPTPRMTGQLELWVYNPLPTYNTVNDIIDLPPGYEIAYRYNFAMVLLPEYPRSQPDQSLPGQAQMYKASIVQLNAGNHMRSQSPSTMQAAAANAGENVGR